MPTLKDSLKSLGILLAATLLTQWFDAAGFSDANMIMVYLLAVLLTAMLTNGFLYGTAVSLLSVFIFNYLYTEPRFTLRAYDADYPVTFLVMFVVSLLAGTLTIQVKTQAKLAATKAHHTQILLETSQKLQQARSETEILQETARQLGKLLSCSVVVYPIHENHIQNPFYMFHQSHSEVPSSLQTPLEQEVIAWVLEHNQQAGKTTRQFPLATGFYRTVRSKEKIFAVIGLLLEHHSELEPSEKELLTATFNESSLALEKERLNRINTQISMTAQQEQLRANLLRSISHDLRTPLTSISGNADFLMQQSIELSEEQRREFYRDIYEDAMWLNTMVENLLFITRIENDTMQLNLQPELLQEVIEEALTTLQRRVGHHRIVTNLGDEMLMARMESRLIIQVILNLLDNAFKYTPVDSCIELGIRREGSMIIVSVADDGPGIDDNTKSKLFDLFHTGPRSSADGRRGLGLGLALCKAIIHAHGGQIQVHDREPHGTLFEFSLPAEEVILRGEENSDLGGGRR